MSLGVRKITLSSFPAPWNPQSFPACKYHLKKMSKKKPGLSPVLIKSICLTANGNAFCCYKTFIANFHDVYSVVLI